MRVGGQVLLGLVHDLQQNAPLPRQPHAAPFERAAQSARLGVRVEPLSGRDATMIVCGAA